VCIAVTAAMGVILGAAFCRSSDTDALTRGYGEFKEEAAATFPDVQPQSVNVDGWEATQNAWIGLFPQIVVMRCFLHLVLGIQQRCRSQQELFADLTQDLWHLYESQNRAEFGQRLRRLQEGTSQVPAAIREKLLKLNGLAPNLKQTFDHPQAARTSNAVDRMMNYQDRVLYSMQYFHGSQRAAQKAVRSMAILWNFHPFIPKVQRRAPNLQTPFKALNGFAYHHHWLRNLLIAASLNGRNTGLSDSHKIKEN
jgi:hypothetical protein